MSNDSSITLVIPTGGRDLLLLDTLRSVSAQTDKSFECLVVDDLCREKKPEEMEDIWEENWRWLTRTGSPGGCGARNTGLHEAKGNWVIFLDDDDLLFPHCIESRKAAIREAGDIDFLVSPAVQFDQILGDRGAFLCFPQEYQRSDLERMLIHDQPWLTTGPTWRKTFLVRAGAWSEELSFLQDWELNFRVLLNRPNYQRLDRVDSGWRRPVGKAQSIGSTRRPVSDVIAVIDTILPLLEEAQQTAKVTDDLATAGLINLTRVCRSPRTLMLGLKRLRKSPLWDLASQLGLRKLDPFGILLLRYALYLRDSKAFKDRLFNHWPITWRSWRDGRNT